MASEAIVFEPTDWRDWSYTDELMVRQDSATGPGWFIIGRNAERFGGRHTKLVAWPDRPLRKHPHYSGKVRFGWPRKRDAEAVAVVLRERIQAGEGGGIVRPNPATLSPERQQFLADLFTTALEGGVNYWAEVVAYHWAKPDVPRSAPMDERFDFEGYYAVIRDAEGDGKEHRIDRQTIQRGLGKVMRGEVRVHESYVQRITQASRENDAGNLDAGDCDVIVQAGALGEVVYG